MLKDLRHLPVAGAHNVRDLGGYRTAGGVILPWRRFLRADSLHRIAPGELDRLAGEGIGTVIDLRTPGEIAEAPNPFRARPGVDFLNLPLFDDLAPAALGQVKGAPRDALLDFYLAALHRRQDSIRAILAAMADAQDGAVLFNCTAGKDRTGIVAALLLSVADVPRQDILADYAISAELISKLVAEFLELSRQRGGDTEAYARMLQSPARTMEHALGTLDAEHGSVGGYLSAIGLHDAQVAALHARLTQHPG